MRLDTTTAVQTPERVRFRYRIAGPGRRGVAWTLDALLQSIVLAFVALVVLALGRLGLEGFGIGGGMVVLFVVQWFYGACFEILLSGRTPGKLVLSLRVVTLEGAPAQPRQFLLRNLLTGADFLPALFGVGVLVMAMDDKLRRIGDRVAGTVVVDESRTAIEGTVSIEPPVHEEERRSTPARVDLTRDELRAIEEFMRRRPTIPAGRARELAAVLADVLGPAVGLTNDDPERLLVLAYARASGRDRELE